MENLSPKLLLLTGPEFNAEMAHFIYTFIFYIKS